MPIWNRRQESVLSSRTASASVTLTVPALTQSTRPTESSSVVQSSASARVSSHSIDEPTTQLPLSSVTSETVAASSARFHASSTEIATLAKTSQFVASNSPERLEATSTLSPIVSSGSSRHVVDNATAAPSPRSSIASAFQGEREPPPNTGASNPEEMSPSSSTQLSTPKPLARILSSSTSTTSDTAGTITSTIHTSQTLAAPSATKDPMKGPPSVETAQSSRSSKNTLVVVFAVLFSVVCFAFAVYFLYRHLRRRRGSSYVRNYRPARGIEVRIDASIPEEKVDVVKPSVQVQENPFLLSPHNTSSTNLSMASTLQSQSQSQSPDPYEPRAISTDDAVHIHHVHGESTDSTNSSHESAMSSPYSGMALFASPATTFTSVSAASPQTRRNRFAPSWHYSPRAPPRSASRTSNKLQDTRDALLGATWKGHMLSSLLEGDASQRRTR